MNIGTVSGKLVSLIEAQPADISLSDIATQLARTNRFNGATVGGVITVAQHSINVAAAVNVEGLETPEAVMLLRRAALLHDAHEAYTGDICWPIKQVLGPEAVKRVEGPLQRAIHRRFGLTAELPEEWTKRIHIADMQVFTSERRHHTPKEWGRSADGKRERYGEWGNYFPALMDENTARMSFFTVASFLGCV